MIQLMNNNDTDIYKNETIVYDNEYEYNVPIFIMAFTLSCLIVCSTCSKISTYYSNVQDKHIKQLETYLFQNRCNIDENNKDECSICLQPLIYHGFSITLPCNHSYHSSCISCWFNKELTCPNCRTEVII